MTRLLPVARVVPHQPPMLALERLLAWESGRARARLVVPDRPPARAGAVDAVMTLEYMAQAVAACLGHEAVNAGHGVRVGMIVACRSLHLARPRLRVGEVLEVECEEVHATDTVSRFEARTLDDGGRVVATASLTLVHGEAPPAAGPG